MFDTHAHLQDERLGDPAAVLNRARSAGVTRLLCCGAAESDWPQVAALAERFPDAVQPAFGLHPWYLRDRSSQWREKLARLLQTHPASAVGEIGLDHGLPDFDPAEQEEVFLQQMRLARELGRPVSIHGRQAWARLVELLALDGPHPAGAVLHSYSGPPELIPRFAALNCYFSFSGAATRAKNRRAHRALAATPPERMLLESDAPDLPMEGLPPPTDGSRPISEPAHLPLIADVLARLLGVEPETLARRCTENGERVFGRWPLQSRRSCEAL